MTTKRSYEDQLSMMSDHLCSMNETLTKQREEIDTLKMASKVSWQGWHGALAAAGAVRVMFGVLQCCPWAKQLTSCNSYSEPAGKKTPNLLLQVPSDGRSHHFFFFCLNVVKMGLFVNPAGEAGWLWLGSGQKCPFCTPFCCSKLCPWQLVSFSVLFP